MMDNTRTAVRKNKAMLAVCLFAILFMSAPALHERMTDHRWYRDLAGLTPFHSVQTHSAQIVEGGIVLTGEMIKRRCVFSSLTGYALFADAPRERLVVDTSPENAIRPPGSRPPSREAELWGPWKLVWSDPRTPTGFEVYAFHTGCSGTPRAQANLFVRGRWKDLEVPE